MRQKTLALLSGFFLLAIILTACSAPTPEIELIPTQEMAATATEIVNPQPPIPLETLSNLLDADLVLWAPLDTAPELIQSYESILQGIADQRGLTFRIVDSLSRTELSEKTRLVISLHSSEETQEIASGAVQTQFLGIGLSESDAAGNVHVLTTKSVSVEEQAFLAGYALALVTPEYRVASLSQSGSLDGNRSRDGFITGVRYYCGLCRSTFAPVLYYPFTAEIMDPVSSTEWQTAIEGLIANGIKAIYIQPELSSSDLVAYLSERGLAILGVENQTGLEKASNLIGILTNSPLDLLASTAENLLDGVQVGVVHGDLGLEHVNEALMTEGKHHLFNRIKQDLLDGLIKALPFDQ